MKRYRFQAPIQRSTGWGAFVIFPHNTVHEFGVKGRVPVQALFEKLAYTGSLMPQADGYHQLAVPKPIISKLGKVPGNLIDVTLWKDDAPRTVELPNDFIDILRTENLLAPFEELTLTRRKEYRNWITSAKREETRQRRMAKALEWMKSEARR